jgi:hypothetical protein
MRSDSEIKRDVEDELRWTPDLDPTDIGVAVKNGVVTLTGFVRSYSQKYEAEKAAKRVAGIVGLANDLEVRLAGIDERPDPDIARDAVAALKNQLPYSWEHIKVVVKEGWITLEGEGGWLLGLAGIASIVFGVLVFLFPGAGALALVWLISFYAMFMGALLLALAFRVRAWARAADRREAHSVGVS